MSQWNIIVESTIITEHTVNGDTIDEAEKNAIKMASQEVPGADDHQIAEVEEIE